jgi:hypothetical protein
MGEARIRGTLEQRKAQAIKSGRKKRSVETKTVYCLDPFTGMLLAVADLAVGPRCRTVEQLRAER